MKITDLITPKTKLTFLAGAGISMDSPSNLPSATKIVESLLNMCAPLEEIPFILDIENLRYEMFVELLQESIDPNLQFLDYLNQVTTPNYNHIFLAKMISKGFHAITTNYDNLIEHALSQMIQDGSDPKKKLVPIITRADFLKFHNPRKWFRKGKWLLYKLHGSKKNIITNENTEESLQTTISALVRNKEEGETFRIHPYKRKAFNTLLKGRILVVMGYSGSDDFDITSTLAEVRDLEAILWITHEEHDVTDPIMLINPKLPANEVLSSFEQRLCNFASSVPFKIYRIRGVTANILKDIELIFESGLKSRTSDEESHNLVKNLTDSENFSDWVRSIYSDIPEADKLLFAWDCLFQFGLYERALVLAQKGITLSERLNQDDLKWNFLNKISSIHRAREEFDEALKIAYAILEHFTDIKDFQAKTIQMNTIGMILYRKMSYKKALKYAKKAYRMNKNLDNQYGMEENLFLLARIYSQLNKNRKSLKIYWKLLESADREGDLNLKSNILDSIGRIYEDTNRTGDILPYFLEALKIGELLGDLPNSFITSDNIAMVYYDEKNWKKAILYFQRALEIAESIGENDIAFIQFDQSIGHLLPYLSECYENLGEFQTSLEYIERCLKRDEAFGIKESVKIDLETMGRIYDKMGRKNEAERYFSKAQNVIQEANSIVNKG